MVAQRLDREKTSDQISSSVSAPANKHGKERSLPQQDFGPRVAKPEDVVTWSGHKGGRPQDAVMWSCSNTVTYHEPKVEKGEASSDENEEEEWVMDF